MTEKPTILLQHRKKSVFLPLVTILLFYCIYLFFNYKKAHYNSETTVFQTRHNKKLA